MGILIVGSGCSALYLASLISFYKKEIKVDILSNENIIGKKILVTGNGRCNLGNLNKDNKHAYNNKISEEIVNEFSIENIIDFLSLIGIHTTNINELVYPYSLSSKNYRENLANFVLSNKNITVLNDLKIIDYKTINNKVNVIFDKYKKEYEKVIFATGGISGNNKNSLEIIGILKKHNYNIVPFKPGLTPIKTKENTKLVEGKRIKCKVSLLLNENLIYEEKGEVLFKKDGLSGIAIFNCSSLINREIEHKNFQISLDLFSDLSNQELIELLIKFNKNTMNSLLNSFFDKEISSFIMKLLGFKKSYNYSLEEIKILSKALKDLRFNYLFTYDFKDSQVSIGGISYSNLKNDTLESKLEKNIYFIGEILDTDGLCGGYNLMFAFASSYRVLKSL